MHRLLSVLPLLLAATPALSQPRSCVAPAVLPAARPDGPSESQPRRLLPIGGYTLALTWSPEACRRPGEDDAFRCGGARERFGWTLHGLWPDGAGAEWPQYCRPARIVDARTVRATLCVTPSVQLIQHEWAKHGTCMPGETPATYFARARTLFGQLRFPAMTRLAARDDLTAGDVARAFSAANPGIAAEAVRVTVTRDGWLDELWLCRDTRLRPEPCPAHQGGAAPDTRLRVRPARR